MYRMIVAGLLKEVKREGINKCVVRGTPIPNYSNAISKEQHQHDYLLSIHKDPQ